MKLAFNTPKLSPSAVRMGAEQDAEARKRDLQLNAQEASLSQAEVNVEANKAPLEEAQEQLEKNQAELHKAEAQLSRSQAEIDERQSQVSEAKVDESVTPSFSGSERKGDKTMNDNRFLHYVYGSKNGTSSSSKTESQAVFAGVNPDVMNQINRVDFIDPAATQADKQPESPSTTVEITSPTQAVLSKTLPDDEPQREPKNQTFSTLDISKN
jgi:hypothetical protein